MPHGIKPTIEFVKQEFLKRGYILLETEYIDSKTLMSYICNEGHQQKIRWNNFKNGQQCKQCFLLTQKYSIDDVKNFLLNIGYQLLSDTYKDNHQKLDMICNNGHNIKLDFNKLKLGTRCKLCFHDNLRANYEDIKQLFEDNGCSLLSETYNNCDEKLKFCCECGNISYISYYSFKLGYRCGCQNSLGENIIKKYLTSKNIKYISQKTFPDCKNRQKLRFDFYIDNKFLLEFDGEQHFKYYRAFGKDHLERNKLHDKIKNEYCLKNNIKLIRISYKEIKKIEVILDEYIKNFDNKEMITYSNANVYNEMKKNITI